MNSLTHKSFINMYGMTVPNVDVKQPITVRTPEDVAKGIKLLDDDVNITLAEYDRETKDAITAHRLKDYRCKQFTVVLLPHIETLFDILLEGGGYTT